MPQDSGIYPGGTFHPAILPRVFRTPTSLPRSARLFVMGIRDLWRKTFGDSKSKKEQPSAPYEESHFQAFSSQPQLFPHYGLPYPPPLSHQGYPPTQGYASQPSLHACHHTSAQGGVSKPPPKQKPKPQENTAPPQDLCLPQELQMREIPGVPFTVRMEMCCLVREHVITTRNFYYIIDAVAKSRNQECRCPTQDRIITSQSQEQDIRRWITDRNEKSVRSFLHYRYFCPSCFLLALVYTHHLPHVQIEAHYHRIMMMLSILFSRDGDKVVIGEDAKDALTMATGVSQDRLVVIALEKLRNRPGVAFTETLNTRYDKARKVMKAIPLNHIQQAGRDRNSRSIYLALLVGLALNILALQFGVMRSKDIADGDLEVLCGLAGAIVALNDMNGSTDSLRDNPKSLNIAFQKDREALSRLKKYLHMIEQHVAQDITKDVNQDLTNLRELAEFLMPPDANKCLVYTELIHYNDTEIREWRMCGDTDRRPGQRKVPPLPTSQSQYSSNTARPRTAPSSGRGGRGGNSNFNGYRERGRGRGRGGNVNGYGRGRGGGRGGNVNGYGRGRGGGYGQNGRRGDSRPHNNGY
ncbi:MAG: hypothetical protein ABW189_00370 [Rickettsiales bacterium]